jgi:hypothetical protein
MNDLDVETWQMRGRRCRVDTSRPRVAPLNSYTVRLHLDEESRGNHNRPAEETARFR